jgi:hypothetical protein
VWEPSMGTSHRLPNHYRGNEYRNRYPSNSPTNRISHGDSWWPTWSARGIGTTRGFTHNGDPLQGMESTSNTPHATPGISVNKISTAHLQTCCYRNSSHSVFWYVSDQDYTLRAPCPFSSTLHLLSINLWGRGCENLPWEPPTIHELLQAVFAFGSAAKHQQCYTRKTLQSARWLLHWESANWLFGQVQTKMWHRPVGASPYSIPRVRNVRGSRPGWEVVLRR